MSEAKTYNLLPCPFCGEQPMMVRHEGVRQWWTVLCDRRACLVRPYVAGSASQAARAWNTRDGKAP